MTADRALKAIVKDSYSQCKAKQSQDTRCGPKFGNKICKGLGVWCDLWSWCGKTMVHSKTRQAAYSGTDCGVAPRRVAVKAVAARRVAVKAVAARRVAVKVVAVKRAG